MDIILRPVFYLKHNVSEIGPSACKDDGYVQNCDSHTI
jgi:hypothetical protein